MNAAKEREIDAGYGLACGTHDGEGTLLGNAHSIFLPLRKWNTSVRVVFGSPPIGIWISTLCRAILHIVGLGAEPQMIGTNAISNVASMQDKESAGNWALVDFVRKSMRKVLFAVDRNRAVACAIEFCCPKPACWRLVYLGPKGRVFHSPHSITGYEFFNRFN